MQPTPIKINKSPNDNSKPTKNVLNLNDSLASSSTSRSGPNKPPSNDKTKKYLGLLLVLVLIANGGLVWLYLAKPISPYSKLLPQDAIISSYFNQASLIELFKNNADWPLIAQGGSELKDWLAKTKIEQPEQALKLFGDQMALAIDRSATWLMLATVKVPIDVFLQAKNKAEQTLKQNYNIIGESYRQITITQIKPLNQEEGNLFYARVQGYFMLANDSALIKTTIDKIIK